MLILMKRVIAVLFLLASGCTTTERPASGPFRKPDLGQVSDGVYPGIAVHRGFEYRVATTIAAHRIADIQIAQNKNSRYGRRAEGVIPLIIQRQQPDVDGVSGATLCSTGLKRAVEDSLLKAAATSGRNGR